MPASREASWQLTSNGSAETNYEPLTSTIHYSVALNAGTGTITLEISYDSGVTWDSLENSTKTQTGQSNFINLPPGILLRPNLSEGSTPDFTIRVYSI